MLTKEHKQEKLVQWVRDKNAKVEPRKFDWMELWEEVKPFFEKCEGDNKLRLRLMIEAYNYR